MKSMRKPKSNSLSPNYTNTHLDKRQKDQMNTWEPNSSSFATKDNNDGDGSGDTYSSCSIRYPGAPSNPDTPSHHAPVPPSLSPKPSESILEPPGDLSPSPAFRIETETPSLPMKLEKKACSAAHSSSVFTGVDWELVEWGLVDWRNWRNSWEERGSSSACLFLATTCVA